MRRVIVPVVAAAVGLVAVLVTASPAAAHTEWEPATAAPGSVIDLTLVLEDEQPDGGTSLVELQFPQPITVVALPATPGWIATLVDGQVGGAPATGVTWSGGPAPDDLHLPITLGPLPNEPGRLQFRAVQTYDNGVVDSWIQDWPEGAPEPDNPGPVLDLVPGGPGTIPSTTTTSTTTEAPPTTSAQDDQEAAPGQEDDEDDDSDDSALPLVIAVLVVLAIAAGVYALVRSRRGPGTSAASTATTDSKASGDAGDSGDSGD